MPSSSSAPPVARKDFPLRSGIRACLFGLVVLVIGFAGGVGVDLMRSKSFAAPMFGKYADATTDFSASSQTETATSAPSVAAGPTMDSAVGSAFTPAPSPTPSPSPSPTPTVGEILPYFSSGDAPHALRHVAVNERLVALTFDDGPSPGRTRRLMEFLESRRVPATFFFIGKQVEQFPELARDAARRGFELGCHTYSHLDLARAASDKSRQEIDLCQKAFATAGVPAPELVRFPYGNSTPSLRRYCQSLRLGMVAWEVDTRDWEASSTADLILKRVMAEVTPGSILLMHERPEVTWQALPRVLDYLEQEGYRPVTVGDLLRAGYEGR